VIRIFPIAAAFLKSYEHLERLARERQPVEPDVLRKVPQIHLSTVTDEHTSGGCSFYPCLTKASACLQLFSKPRKMLIISWCAYVSVMFWLSWA